MVRLILPPPLLPILIHRLIFRSTGHEGADECNFEFDVEGDIDIDAV